MKDEFLAFVSAFSIRKTRAQKKYFLSQMTRMLRKQGIKVHLQQTSLHGSSIRNLIIHDLNQADVIIFCGYDTTGRKILPFCYEPLKTEKNLRFIFMDTILRWILNGILLITGITLFHHGMRLEPLWWLCIAGSVLCAMIATMWANDMDNHSSLNKSASVFLLLKMAKEKCCTQCAYVLMDQGSYREWGMEVLLKEYPQLREKTMIYLDCLAMGKQLVLAQKMEQNEKITTWFKQCSWVSKRIVDLPFQHRFTSLRKLMILTSSELSEQEIIINNLGYDNTLDVTFMQAVFEWLMRCPEDF